MFYNNIDKLIYVSPINRQYDPLSLYRKLIIHSGGVINDRLAVWSDPEKSETERMYAEENLVTITRACFDLKTFDCKDGVTDGVALNCLTDFVGWIEKNG